jgi:hypothetical protein
LAPLAVCDACENSPLCDACGHPRGDHGQVFIRGVAPGCNWVIGDFPSLTQEPCDCAGFRPIRGAIRDAAFAEAQPEPAELPKLRLADSQR